MPLLNSSQAAALACMAGRGGSAMAAELTAAMGSANPAAMRKTVADGLATKGHEDGDPRQLGRPLKSVWTITASGRAQLEQLRRRIDPESYGEGESQ